MDAEVEGRLLQRHAVAYEFRGILQGCATMVRATWEDPGEGVVILRHYNNPWLDLFDPKIEPALKPAVLAERETKHDQGFYWIPWDPRYPEPDDFFVLRHEDERVAIKLALRIADGEITPGDMTLRLARPTEPPR